MYAVIATGGKQYQVAEGDVIRIEKLAIPDGETVDFDKVLAIRSDTECNIGTPYLESHKVTGTIVASGKGKKIRVIKFKRRKQYMRTQGHRQQYTDVKITKII